MRVYRPMTPSGRQCAAREEHPALLDIGSMSPPDYPSAWLHPCRARFRFTWQVDCSSCCCVSPSFFSELVNFLARMRDRVSDTGSCGARVIELTCGWMRCGQLQSSE